MILTCSYGESLRAGDAKCYHLLKCITARALYKGGRAQDYRHLILQPQKAMNANSVVLSTAGTAGFMLTKGTQGKDSVTDEALLH